MIVVTAAIADEVGVGAGVGGSGGREGAGGGGGVRSMCKPIPKEAE